MEIVRLAEPRCPHPLRPAALVLAVLLNGTLIALIAVTRQAAPPDEADSAIEILLVESEPKPSPAPPKPEPAPAKTGDEPPPDAPTVAAPRPGTLPPESDAGESEAPLPALWSLVCSMVPPDLRDLRPDCRDEGDPLAARTGPLSAGIADQRIRDRPLGDLLGGKFAGKDRYQIEVMLGLRSTSLGTRYHIPVGEGPEDEPTDHSDTDRVLGISPIPDG